MHCVWTLPPGDADYSLHWRLIKTFFCRALPPDEHRSAVRLQRGERGVWQRRYWEHMIRDEFDFRRHIDYVYVNPLKHGLVRRVCDCPYSSFHRDVRADFIRPTGRAILRFSSLVRGVGLAPRNLRRITPSANPTYVAWTASQPKQKRPAWQGVFVATGWLA